MKRTDRTIKSIAIQNPRVVQIIMEEWRHGCGRGPTEAAENLILDEADRRRLARVRVRAQGKTDAAKHGEQTTPEPSAA